MTGGRGARLGCALGVMLVLSCSGCEDATSEVENVVTQELVLTSQRGVMHDGCTRDSDCGGGAICPAAYGYCVRPCRSDADCGAPSRCLLDRLEINFCGCEGAGCDSAGTRAQF